MKVDKKCFIAAAWVCAPFLAQCGTYTWLASPANNNWDTSSVNWNDGSADVAWVDDAVSPNDAVFPNVGTTTITIGSGTRYVNDLTLQTKCTINGSGGIDIAGTLFAVANTPTLAANFVGTCLRINGATTLYLKGLNSSQNSTRIRGDFICAIDADDCLGSVPSEPADNIFIDSGPVCLYANKAFTLSGNRTVKIAPGAALRLGGALTVKGLISAENSPGCDFSTNTAVRIPNTWTSVVTLDPGEGKTNVVGNLEVQGHLCLASGGVRVGGARKGTGNVALLYVNGNGSGYNSGKGNLEVTGATLYGTQDYYADIKSYGQVSVTGNGKINMPNCTWLHGDGSPARLTIADGGEVCLKELRVSMAAAGTEVHLNEGGLLSVEKFIRDATYDVNTTGTIRFDGGSIQSKEGKSDFFGNPTSSMWNGKIRVLVGEKGAVFDTSNNKVLWMGRPLESDAEHDGGVRKVGSNVLVFLATNYYNGVTVVEGGGIQLRSDNALPPGSTLRLAGSGTYVGAYTYDSAKYTEQWLSRVEGCGQVQYCSQVHVTNSIAPSAGGTLVFIQTCDLRGSLELSADENGCGVLEVQGSNQSISGLTLTAADLGSLDKGSYHRIFKATKGYTGTFAMADGFPSGWRVKYVSDGAYLHPVKGLTVIVR